MTTLKFADTHNMIVFLSKPTESDGYEQIVDFLNAHPIRYASTINPMIYVSCIEQLWSTVKAKTINREERLHALVDGKKIIVTESSVRRDLQLEDAEGVDCLPNSTIFEQLTLMGPKTIALNEFSSTMASAIICLAANKKFNFNIHEDAIRSWGDSLGRAATTASSLEAKQDNGRQEHQHNEIASLKRRVKKLEKKDRSRTHRVKRLYKVGLTARVESSDNEENLGDDASKQERIDAIDADEEITLVVEVINTAKLIIDAAQVSDAGDIVSTASATTIVSVDDITLAQAFEEMKSTKPKMKGALIVADIMAERMQAQEQEDLSIEEKATIFQQLLEKRRKHFAAKRAERKETKSQKNLKQRKDNIYMLVEKKYPLTPSTLSMMLEKKLIIDYESEMAYQLLKFIMKQP
ncbi:hypothetical protein Tco_0868882 [Tanacetum coccineum]